jgi:hypothetical protein
MPLTKCQKDGNPGYKWGEEGNTCYTYDPNSQISREIAKRKALKQGKAIEISKRNFVRTRISFDYDGVLSTARGRNLLKRELSRGYDVYIISARGDKERLIELTKDLGIPENNIYAMGSNLSKITKIKQLNIRLHWDDNPFVVDQLGVIGRKF